MNAPVKECRPVVTTAPTWDVYDAGKLFNYNSIDEISYLSKLLIDSRNLTYRQALLKFNRSTANKQIRTKIFDKDFINSLSQYFYEDIIMSIKSFKPQKKEFVIKNENNLKHNFELALADYNDKEFSKDTINKCFNLVFKEIAKLKFNHVNLFINNNNKIKFTLYFDNEKILMINKSFELIDSDNLISYSLFSSKELIVSDIVEIRTLINGFIKYLEA